MPHYLPRPLPVFALQYTGDNAEEIIRQFSTRENRNLFWAMSDSGQWLWTPDGWLTPDSFILRDHNGNISVMSMEEFEERYVEATT